MAKKRKADASRLDEADRNLYANFRGAANALSQLYAQTINQQRISFHSGERHALEKLYQWILKRQEEGSRVTIDDTIAYIQDEIEFGTDDTTLIFPSPLSNQYSQPVSQSPPLDAPVSCGGLPSPTNVGFDNQGKNSLFTSALSSSAHPSPQHCQLTDNIHYNNAHSSGNRPSSGVMQEQSQPDFGTSEDYTDMLTDVPGQKSAYRWFKQE